VTTVGEPRRIAVAPGPPVPGRQRCSCTTPGSSISRPVKNRLTSAWLRIMTSTGAVWLYSREDLGHLRGRYVGGRVRHDQIAPRWHASQQPGHDRMRVMLIGDAMQNSQRHERDRPIEVEGAGCLCQQAGGVAQVGAEVSSGTLAPPDSTTTITARARTEQALAEFGAGPAQPTAGGGTQATRGNCLARHRPD
jgi:hypothetical protein